MQQFLTIDDFRTILQEDIERSGSQVAWAKRVGLHHSDVSNALSGRRMPTKKLLKALKLRKVLAFERV